MVGIDIQSIDCEVGRPGKNSERRKVFFDDKCFLMRLAAVPPSDDPGIPGRPFFEFVFKNVFRTALAVSRDMRSAIVQDHSQSATSRKLEQLFCQIRFIKIIGKSVDGHGGVVDDFSQGVE